MFRFICVLVSAVVFIFGTGIAQAQTVGFATLPPGAINNITVQVMSKVVQKNSTLRMRVLPFRGGEAVTRAVNTKKAEFGITEVASLTAALTGLAGTEYDGEPTKNLRVALRLRPILIGMFVLKDSPIKAVIDIKGKRYPSGWSQFPNAIPLSLGIMATEGLSFKDIKGVPVTNIIRGANDFKAGKLDIGFFALGAPKMAEVNSAVGGIRWLNVRNTPETLKAMRAVRPDYYIATAKPSPIMAGISSPTNVLAVDTVIFVGTHVAASVVEEFVAAVFANKSQLVKGHPLSRAYNPKLMGKQFKTAKYHPGAISFYKKKGIWSGS